MIIYLYSHYLFKLSNILTSLDCFNSQVTITLFPLSPLIRRALQFNISEAELWSLYIMAQWFPIVHTINPNCSWPLVDLSNLCCLLTFSWPQWICMVRCHTLKSAWFFKPNQNLIPVLFFLNFLFSSKQKSPLLFLSSAILSCLLILSKDCHFL